VEYVEKQGWNTDNCSFWIIIVSFTGFALGLSSIVLIFGVFSFVQGLGRSTGWTPLAGNISNWFSLCERGVIMECWPTNYTIGLLVADPATVFMVDYFHDHRYAFFIPTYHCTFDFFPAKESATRCRVTKY
jgi:sugar phosphate permease